MTKGGHHVVLIHKNPYLERTRAALLERSGYSVKVVHHVEHVHSLCLDGFCDLVIVDSEGEHRAAIEICDKLKQDNPALRVVVVAWYNTPVQSECPDEVIRREEGPEGFLAAVQNLLPSPPSAPA